MSCKGRAAALALAGVVLSLGGCGRLGTSRQVEKPAGVIRLAILRVDDQRANQDETWPAVVLPVAIVRQFANQEGIAARTADAAPTALHSGATHLVHLRLIDQAGGVELLLDIERVAPRRIEHAGTARAGAGAWLKAAIEAAGMIQAAVAGRGKALLKPGVPGETAMAQLGQALSAEVDGADALADVARAFPDCGWCWEASAERLINEGDRQAALAIIEESRRAQGLGEAACERLRLAESGLRQDQAMRGRALERLAQLTPCNVEVLSELAARAARQKRFGEAATAWKRVLAIDPGSLDAMNQLGYAEAWRGRFEEGLKWHKAYAAADPGSANAADSMGEVLMMAGRFEEAERAFVLSYQKNGEFNAGAALEKAALACWLRGDEAAAGRRLEEFLKDRAARGDPLVDWRRARWLYLTGKTDEAKRVLEVVRADGAPAARAFALVSLALWSAESGDRAGAMKRLAPLVSAPHPAVSRILPLAVAIVQPRPGQPRDSLAAGISALIAGDDGAAVVALKAAQQSSEPGEDSLARELLAWAHVRAGDVAAAAALLGAGWPIPATLEGQLTDFLVYPNLLYVRAKVAARNQDAAGAARLFEMYLRAMGTRPDARRQKDEARRSVRL